MVKTFIPYPDERNQPVMVLICEARDVIELIFGRKISLDLGMVLGSNIPDPYSRESKKKACVLKKTLNEDVRNREWVCRKGSLGNGWSIKLLIKSNVCVNDIRLNVILKKSIHIDF